MQHGLNKPLTSRQVSLLRIGFTPTSIGITGQQIKRMGRASNYSTTNRRITAGRTIQYIPVALKDSDNKVVREAGTVKHVKSYKAVWHRISRY